MPRTSKKELERIRSEILRHNNWLNGMVDYRDGDLMAIANAEDDVPKIIEVKSLREAYSMLKKYDNASVKVKKLIFMQHWNYGTFVYRLPKLKSYIEHYTMSAMDFDSFYRTSKDLLN